jgi:antitoxin component of MazEF toxin-antitoxin module
VTVIVKQLGGSVAVVIPKALAREMGLTEGTALDISSAAGGMVLRKQGRRPRRPLSGIVAEIEPASYRRRRREFAEDRSVGKEIG